MSREQEAARSADTVPLRPGSTVPTRDPGKRALTDSMSAPRTTGFPLIDEGTGAETGLGRAWLEPWQRERTLGMLGNRVNLAHTNRMGALVSRRIELLVTREHGWGAAAELLCNLFTYTVAGTLVGALARFRKGATAVLTADVMRIASGVTDSTGRSVKRTAQEWAERIHLDTVAAALAHGGRAFRSHVKGGTGGLPQGAAGKAAFLALMADGSAVEAAHVMESLPTVLDDDGLLLLVESYEPTAHVMSVYTAAIDDLLARYQRSEIASVGLSWEHNPDAMRGEWGGAPPADRDGRLDVVRFRHRGRERSALVEQPYTMQRMLDPLPGAVQPTSKSTLQHAAFVRWLDDDLAGVATDNYRARVGGPPLVHNVDQEPLPASMAGPVATWIATAKEQP
jgi:hypothetical protein